MPDFTYVTLDGVEVDFDEFRDGRPALVNFFSETCVPCVTEMPDLEEAHQAHGDEVAFLGLAYPDTSEQAQELVDRTGVTYDIGLGTPRRRRSPPSRAASSRSPSSSTTTGRSGTSTSAGSGPDELEAELEALTGVIDAPLALAFSAGMVATVNPCGFAMLPAYLSFFLGLEGGADDEDRRAGVARALAVGAAVTAGLRGRVHGHRGGASPTCR